MKTVKRWISMALVLLLLAGCLPAVLPASAANANLALNKEVTTSSVRPARSELVGALAVDGIDDDESSRWSSKMATGKGDNEGPSEDGTVEQWLMVDLGDEFNLSQIYLSWENAYATSYKIQTSVNGMDFVDIYADDQSTGGKQTIDKDSFTSQQSARYVKILCLTPKKDTWGYSIYELAVYGAPVRNENLALNKPVEFSGVEGGKVGDNWKYPQFVGEKAVDGDVSTRWSADKTDDQWLVVDLEQVYTLSQININFFRAPLAYTVEVSQDGVTYTPVLEVENNPDINVEHVKEIPFPEQSVRYIKIHQTQMFTNPDNGQKYGGSIFEVEAYRHATADLEPQTAQEALTVVENEGFTLPQHSGEAVVFPESVTKHFDVSIYGSDYQPIVGLDGIYHQPLVDKDIHVMYQVTSKDDPEDVATSTKDCTVHIPGQYADDGGNAAPAVVPTLQEWYGHTGTYQLTDTSAIVYSDASLSDKAQLIQTYLSNLVGVEVSCRQGTDPAQGDIYLELTQADDIPTLGEEGYELTVDDTVTVRSSTVDGAFYGGVTVAQALYLRDDGKINKGICRDYPKYEVRSIALDVARSEIQLDYIEEITQMLPFFKINEIMLHINDDRGDKITNTEIGSEENIQQTEDLSAFRIENDQGIGSHAYQISKEDYIQYQKDAAEYGVTVVTELDTPAHSAVFSLLPEMEENMYDVRHLKITENSTGPVEDVTLYQPTLDFVDALTQELLGDHPGDAVIQTDVFNFGTDEYPTAPNYSEAMMQYINHYTEFVQERGYEARAWAGADGSSGFKGYVTPQNKEVTYYLWAPYWADVKKTLANGNPIINCSGSWLYIVPGGNNGYHDRLNVEQLYNDWSVNNITTTRGSGGAVIPFSHPQLRGASVVLWNDDGFLLDGVSDFDIYDRLKEAFPIIAERTWYGEKTDGQTYADFASRSDCLLQATPASNPAREVASVGDTVASYDFESVQGDQVPDRSENGYSATLTDAHIQAGKDGNAVAFQGDSYLSLPFDTVGLDTTVSFDLYVEEGTSQDAALFASDDGVIHLNQKNAAGEYTGKLGYERDGYTFTFNYTVPTGKRVNLTLTFEAGATKLYVNGILKGSGARTEFGPYVQKNLSTSMVLPTGQIGLGLVGAMDNLVITDGIVDIPEPENLASQAQTVETSNDFDDRYTGVNAVDDNLTTRWATTNDTTAATLTLDFGREVSVNMARIVEYKATYNYVNAYNIEYWDGTDWVVAFTHNVSAGDIFPVQGVGNGYEINSSFDTITASKIRLNLTDASRPSIYEFQLFYVDDGEPQPEADKTLLQKTYDYALTLSTHGVTDSAKAYFEQVLSQAKAVLDNPNATQDQVDTAWDNLLNGIWGLGLTQGDKTMLNLVIARAQSMVDDADKYVETNWQQLVDALAEAQAVYGDGDAMQDQVDQATQTLLGAILAQRYKADKSILEDLVGKAEDIHLEGYTAQSVAVFHAALAEAQAVLADATLSEDDQETVDAAVAKLSAAMDGLTAQGQPETTHQPQVTDAPQTTHKPDQGNVPQTGDTAPLTVAVLLFSAAALALLALCAKGKRRA